MSDTVAVVIVAAGRGTRAAVGTGPKQYVQIAGEAMLTHTVRAFTRHHCVGRIVVVMHPDDAAACREALALFDASQVVCVSGGATRQASVLCGLEALAAEASAPSRVLIHDAARPFVSSAIIDRVIAALDGHEGAIPALELADTLKRARADGTIVETIPRADLHRAQTPQGFAFAAILQAHRAAAALARNDFTDDAALAEWQGMSVILVEGDEANRKLTTREDIAMATQAADGSRHIAADYETRTGQGFDVHRFRDGDHVWLCGVRIPHDHALEGHSDADVGLHALTDALLGAIGDGDIGQHFPPSDERWRGAASHLFLADAMRRVASRGGRIVNVDVTLLCEAPRISGHRETMRARVAEILGVTVDRVGVKATTTERLGFTGRREGIAAMAVATVELPRG
jgi:2-C-methyl-D-erythritol 4-phosphate cytidylyltransferase/2-C-methyl-D-erythritol 2,4-cyclodiphosphate synthase